MKKLIGFAVLFISFVITSCAKNQSNSIDTIKSSLKQAKLSDKEKYDAIKRLNKFIN